MANSDNASDTEKSGRVIRARPGDSVTSLAYEHGLFWEKVWETPENEGLRQKRRSPNILSAGDEVYLPALQPREYSGSTDRRHRFRRRGVASVLRIRVYEPQERERDFLQWLLDHRNDQDPRFPEETERERKPWKGVEYLVEVEGRLTHDKTDEKGYVTVPVEPNAKTGKLILAPGTEQERTTKLELGHLHPIDEVHGVRQRLSNLGYPCGPCDEPSDEVDESLRAALLLFQSDHGLEASGDIDEETKQKLSDEHLS